MGYSHVNRIKIKKQRGLSDMDEPHFCIPKYAGKDARQFENLNMKSRRMRYEGVSNFNQTREA